MAGLLTRQRVLGAKVETTAGTAESITAAEAVFNVYADGPIITPNITMSERPGQSAFSRLPSIPGARAGSARFSTDIFWDTATPAWASTFLPACGMLETSESFAFVTGSATAKTITIMTYEDGKTRTLAGCVGNWTIDLKAGEIGKINWEFVGIYGTDADAALIAPTYPAILPPRWANTSGVVFGAYTPIISAATISSGNTLKLREDANTTSGYKAGIITDRVPTFSIDPETEVVATKNWMSEFLAATQASLAFVVGTASDNIVTVTLPKAQLTTAPTHEDRDGVLVTRVSGIGGRSAAAGDDECTIVGS